MPGDTHEFAFAGQSWRWRKRGEDAWHSGYATHAEAEAAALAAESEPAPTPEPVPVAPAKGHWRKGRSRNLDPAQLAVARTLTELLRSAIERPWRHPTLGVLSYRGVARHLRIGDKAVRQWCSGATRPPAWALAELRLLLKDFKF